MRTDLTAFGNAGLTDAAELLDAWVEKGLPEHFSYSNVLLVHNPAVPVTMLTNSSKQYCKLTLSGHIVICDFSGIKKVF